MNLLFIGPYKGSDGWSEASKAYLKALATIPDINLAARPVYLGQSISREQDPALVEYEYKQLDNIDCVIQKTLPHQFCKLGKFPHIGLTVFETLNLKHHAWMQCCNIVDKIFTPYFHPQTYSLEEECPFLEKIHNIGQPVDLEIFKTEREPLPELNDGMFNFYFIGENITRKNILDLVLAFHTEFAAEEPVRLVIKTSQQGLSPQQLSQVLNEKITRLKERLRLYSDLKYYKQDILITEYLPAELLYRLHKSCHCFVMPSHGEAFCRPMVEAMGFGNQVIVTGKTSMSQFLPNQHTRKIENDKYTHETTFTHIESYLRPVECKDPPISDLYTGREYWQQPNIQHLQSKMRAAYNLGINYKIQYDMSGFSYEAVGKRMKGAL